MPQKATVAYLQLDQLDVHALAYTRPMPNRVETGTDRGRYLRTLAAMSPEQRLTKAFELSDWTRSLFEAGLRQRFPDLSEDALRDVLLERLLKCHNRPS